MAMLSIWKNCLKELRSKEKISEKDMSTWILPLQTEYTKSELKLFAPNQFIQKWVNDKFLACIESTLKTQLSDQTFQVFVMKGNVSKTPPSHSKVVLPKPEALPVKKPTKKIKKKLKKTPPQFNTKTNLNALFTFDNFVEGPSNKLAKASACQVGQHPGKAYNPFLIYGDVGIGKTHLMLSVGNEILAQRPNAFLLYISSERFVADMINALQRNVMDDFKRFYRSAEVLLIDDIQFFSGKGRSQEELFHTLNALLDQGQQIVFTSDRYPKELNGLEERLKSRLGWGLTVGIDLPGLDTRIAIINSKAKQASVEIPSDVSFFLAQRIKSNVRELEGGLKRIVAHAHFKGEPISLDLAQEALKDLLAVQARLITLDNIQKTVASYYKVKLSDLLSKRRPRSIVRPRQIAIALSRALTNHSFAEIGKAFGGRDHTTVLYTCERAQALIEKYPELKKDYNNLLRLLST